MRAAMTKKLSRNQPNISSFSNQQIENDFLPSQGLNQNNGDDGNTSLAAKVAMLEKDLERRQESYISRERAYKVRIDELEEELTTQKQSKTGWMKSDTKVVILILFSYFII